MVSRRSPIPLRSTHILEIVFEVWTKTGAQWQAAVGSGYIVSQTILIRSDTDITISKGRGGNLTETPPLACVLYTTSVPRYKYPS